MRIAAHATMKKKLLMVNKRKEHAPAKQSSIGRYLYESEQTEIEEVPVQHEQTQQGKRKSKPSKRKPSA